MKRSLVLLVALAGVGIVHIATKKKADPLTISEAAYQRAEKRLIARLESGVYDNNIMQMLTDIDFEVIAAELDT